MADEGRTEHRCPTCGGFVRIVSDRDGTNFYVPLLAIADEESDKDFLRIYLTMTAPDDESVPHLRQRIEEAWPLWQVAMAYVRGKVKE